MTGFSSVLLLLLLQSTYEWRFEGLARSKWRAQVSVAIGDIRVWPIRTPCSQTTSAIKILRRVHSSVPKQSRGRWFNPGSPHFHFFSHRQGL
ncbi:hypothetical protein BJY01DRAFT_228863 [Aspergillus pseudoustus]|uniref:Secreted protein n=1 Tax=Aspergillus pseudoustus TaxID=1810923 RepID=A0ABR4IJG9_9EURO